MDSMSEGTLRRIGKLLALADRGVDGERATAETMLANLLAKYGVSLEDITAQTRRTWTELEFDGQYEHTLLLQVVRKVTGKRDFTLRSCLDYPNKVWIEAWIQPVDATH